jgi:hypothetical protein
LGFLIRFAIGLTSNDNPQANGGTLKENRPLEKKKGRIRREEGRIFMWMLGKKIKAGTPTCSCRRI